MDLLEKFEKLNNRLSNLLEENKVLKEENQELKKKLDERDYENLQEENKKLKHLLNLEKQKNDQLEIISQNLEEKYKSLQEGNEKLSERDKQFQQHIQNLEKQKNDQLEIFSQNLEKALGKLELDELDEVNENDDSINYIEDSSANEAPKNVIASTSPPSPPKKVLKKEPITPKVKNNQNHISGYSSERSWSTFGKSGNFRVVVGLDFGTTYSGFSYCHVADSENIRTNEIWQGEFGNLKTNTVLRYDDEYCEVMSWGASALAKRPNRRRIRNNDNNNNNKPVELFKLHLGNLSNNLKPKLPVSYKKAITDYLYEIGKVIKEQIISCWDAVDFFQNVLLVLTVPTEYSEREKAIMRECAFNARLINEKHSTNLQFTTEPEAAAIYCMQNFREYELLETGTTFMMVDCGGGTVDITIRKLIGDNQLGEVTESTGDFCGSTFIDGEFIKFLRKKLGDSAIDQFKENHYGHFQYLIRNFCQLAKLPFTGDDEEFLCDFDIDDAPNLKQYVSDEFKDKMEEIDWFIKISYDDIKAMFDPVVNKIIRMIHLQLSNAQEKCSTMFLVGGFSESKYLQKRIKEEFHNIVNNISVPKQPMAATLRGATLYGLSLNDSENDMEVRCIVSSRILKYTYGVKVRNYWMEGDPIEKKLRNGRIDRFHCIAKRGIQVNINEEFTTFFTPLSPMQTKVCFGIYYTREHNAKYCDEPGMMHLGKLTIDLPGSGHLDKLLFGFTFGQMEIAITVKNETSGQYCKTKFEIDV